MLRFGVCLHPALFIKAGFFCAFSVPYERMWNLLEPEDDSNLWKPKTDNSFS